MYYMKSFSQQNPLVKVDGAQIRFVCASGKLTAINFKSVGFNTRKIYCKNLKKTVKIPEKKFVKTVDTIEVL